MTTEYQPPIDKVINTINEIAETMKNGGEIVYEELPKELRWRWTNVGNGKDWTIRARQLKMIAWNKEDKMGEVAFAFAAGIITAVEAQKQIERLNKLKAFW